MAAGNPSKRADGHVYYVIGGTGGSGEGYSWLYSSGIKYFVDAGRGELNLIGNKIWINGIDFSTVAIGDLKEYAKTTEVKNLINGKFTEIEKNFKVIASGAHDGSVWIRYVEEKINKLPTYTSIKALSGKIDAILEALGAKVGVIDGTAPNLPGDKIEPIKKLFFIKVNKELVPKPLDGVKYYVKNGETYVEGGTEVDPETHERVWLDIDVYVNDKPEDYDDIDWSEIDIINHLYDIDDKLNKVIEKMNEFIG